MAYIQITTHCNMRCAHCVYSCEPGKGEHMTMKMFKKACELAKEFEAGIFLGGGEPTLHPRFLEMFAMAQFYSSGEGGFGLITNGTNRDLTLGLLNASEQGVLRDTAYIAVSYDAFHDLTMLHDDVHDYLSRHPNRRHRDASYEATRVGRAVQGEEDGEVRCEDGCICEDMMIFVDGSVRPCGCPTAPVYGSLATMTSRELLEMIDKSPMPPSQCGVEWEKRFDKEFMRATRSSCSDTPEYVASAATVTSDGVLL